MPPKKRRSPFPILLGIIAVGGLIWIFHDMLRGFDGEITAKRTSGAHVVLEVRDDGGRVVETRVPAAQGDEVSVGDRIHKDAFSRAIRFEKVVEVQVVED